jgi:hypothetical protein
MYPTLLIEAFNCRRHMPVRQKLHSLPQIRVSFAKNLMQLDCMHPCLLKLRKWTASFHALMLPYIAHKQHTVVAMKARHKLVHLPS